MVSVVADQLTLINEYYLHHVATWRTSARLENMVSKLFHNEVFVHERLLRPWYEEPAVRYVAIPHNEYTGEPAEGRPRARGGLLARRSWADTRSRHPRARGRGGEPAALDVPPGRGPGLPAGRPAGGGRQSYRPVSRGEAGLVRRRVLGLDTARRQQGPRALRRLEQALRATRCGARTGRSPTRWSGSARSSTSSISTSWRSTRFTTTWSRWPVGWPRSSRGRADAPGPARRCRVRRLGSRAPRPRRTIGTSCARPAWSCHHRDDLPSWRETATGLLRRDPAAMALVAQARDDGRRGCS